MGPGLEHIYSLPLFKKKNDAKKRKIEQQHCQKIYIMMFDISETIHPYINNNDTHILVSNKYPTKESFYIIHFEKLYIFSI